MKYFVKHLISKIDFNRLCTYDIGSKSKTKKHQQKSETYIKYKAHIYWEERSNIFIPQIPITFWSFFTVKKKKSNRRQKEEENMQTINLFATFRLLWATQMYVCCQGEKEEIPQWTAVKILDEVNEVKFVVRCFILLE